MNYTVTMAWVLQDPYVSKSKKSVYPSADDVGPVGPLFSKEPRRCFPFADVGPRGPKTIFRMAFHMPISVARLN